MTYEIGHIPNRKSKVIYRREGGRIIPVATFSNLFEYELFAEWFAQRLPILLKDTSFD